jgi:hypothetical protein
MFTSLFLGSMAASVAQASCGVVVGPSHQLTEPQNGLAQVVLARDGDRTTITMTGDISATDGPTLLVIPVPAGLRPQDYRLVAPELVDRVDQYTAPRLVADCDQPGIHVGCGPREPLRNSVFGGLTTLGEVATSYLPGEGTGLFLLDAQDSMDVLEWLDEAGFAVPAQAQTMLSAYAQGGAHFLVAEQSIPRVGSSDGRMQPVQFSYRSDMLSLPVALGTVNSPGEQELLLTVIADGQAAVSNVVEIERPPVCAYSGDDFPAFYEGWTDGLLAADGASWVLEYATPSFACTACLSTLAPVDLALLGWDGPPDLAFVTRMRVRYRPDEVDDDLALVLFPGLPRDTAFRAPCDDDPDTPACEETGSQPVVTRQNRAGWLAGVVLVWTLLLRRSDHA